jgi:hypothetical protein
VLREFGDFGKFSECRPDCFIHIKCFLCINRHTLSCALWRVLANSHTPETRRHLPNSFARNHQTRRHLPNTFARTRPTGRHLPNNFARTRQTHAFASTGQALFYEYSRK